MQKDFIKKYVPENAKLHLVGHSIGSWMILNMLKDDDIAKKITKCYLIFPTIEHMARTTNGWWFNRVSSFISEIILDESIGCQLNKNNFFQISKIAFFLIFMCSLFSILPRSLQIFCLNMILPLIPIPLKYNNAMLQFLNPDTVKRVIKMAEEEMEIVKERDDDTISKYADKLWFYYGNCDDWVPVTYYKNLMFKHPELNAVLCKHGYRHSFVLQYDNQMGKLVGDKINDNIV